MDTELTYFERRRRCYAAALMCLLLLFSARVLGQILVAFFHVPFLPPMEEWYSGVIPYPLLLVMQFLIIWLYAKVCRDFWCGSGYFATPSFNLGTNMLYLGSAYTAVMVLRYVIKMSLYPQERWFGGCIPIAFHFVLASFILLVGWYHRTRAQAQKRLASRLRAQKLYGLFWQPQAISPTAKE